MVPEIYAPKLDVTESFSWGDIETAFEAARPVALQQAWQDRPDAGFRPASVRAGWNDDVLLVYAVLEDDHVFNPVTRFNQPAFTEGDVFEIFLRPHGQDAYFEFHINPNNQKFQLRIPSIEAFQANRSRKGNIPREWFLEERAIHSRVKVEPEQRQWRILADVRFDGVVERPSGHPEGAWLFSFSRYDYTPEARSPVLSSTSPHQKVNFHRQQEWGRLHFVS